MSDGPFVACGYWLRFGGENWPMRNERVSSGLASWLNGLWSTRTTDPRCEELLAAVRQYMSPLALSVKGYAASYERMRRALDVLDAFDPPEPEASGTCDCGLHDEAQYETVMRDGTVVYTCEPAFGPLAMKFGLAAPKPKRHTFGGVTFVQTGEIRPPTVGDWYLWSDTAYCAHDKTHLGFGAVPAKILKPVGVEDAD